jgi:predicted Rossmann fold nucleotide-binding protein DprA/Smf involved in DNA uptake
LADDVLTTLAGGEVRSAPVPRAPEPFAAMLDAIKLGCRLPADLCIRLGMALPSLLAALAEAELEGLVRRAPGNTYEVIGRE